MDNGRLLLVQAQTLAARTAGDRGHVIGPWEPGTSYPGGQRDWWMRCPRCGSLAWVLALGDGRGIVQHVPDGCRPG